MEYPCLHIRMSLGFHDAPLPAEEQAPAARPSTITQKEEIEIRAEREAAEAERSRLEQKKMLEKEKERVAEEKKKKEEKERLKRKHFEKEQNAHKILRKELQKQFERASKVFSTNIRNLLIKKKL